MLGWHVGLTEGSLFGLGEAYFKVLLVRNGRRWTWMDAVVSISVHPGPFNMHSDL